MYYDQDKLVAIITEIKSRRGLTNDQLGESIGVTGSQVSYVLNKKRKLSPTSLQSLCETYNINPEELRNTSEKTLPQKIGTVLSKRMGEKNIHLSQLSKESGIGTFRMFDILANKTEPSDDELRNIANVLQIDPKLLLDKSYLSDIIKIRMSLENMRMQKDHIDAVMSFIEQNV